jgi:hypothetical protein
LSRASISLSASIASMIAARVGMADRQLVARGFAEFLHLDDQVVGAQDVRVARRRAQVDAGWNAADAGEFRRHLLGHELAAEARLGALRDVDLQAVGALHVMDVPAQASAQALEDELFGGAALGIRHAALARVLGDPGECRGHADGPFCGGRQRAVAHRGDHHRHRELERLGAVDSADLGGHAHLGDDVGVDSLWPYRLTERQV